MASRNLSLPRGTLKHRNGVAMDIGGSLIKTVCVVPLDDNTDEVHFKSFSRERLDQALSYLKEQCAFLKPGQEVFATGIAIMELQKKIEEHLNVKISSVMKTTCFATALKILLEAFPESVIIHPPSQAAQKGPETYKQQWRHKNQVIETTEMKELPQTMLKRRDIRVTAPPPDANAGIFPLLMVMLGSGCGFVKVTESSYALIDISPRCGRMFLSMGALLTGEKTYEGLMELAQNGDAHKLNIVGNYMKKSSDKNNLYNHLPDDMPLYGFGHVMGKDLGEFSKNDLARALLANICMDLTQTIDLLYHLIGSRSIYVVGSFSGESALCRDELAACMGMRRVMSRVSHSVPVDMKFVKHGAYLGALGALIAGMG